MHSSRMRTARSSSRWVGVPGLGGCTWSWGVYLVLGGTRSWGGVYLVLGGTWSWGVPGLGGGGSAPGGVCSGGVSAHGGCTWSRGVYLVLGGCTWSWGVCSWGHVCSRGCTWSGTPPCGQTHACKRITLPQTSFVGGYQLYVGGFRIIQTWLQPQGHQPITWPFFLKNCIEKSLFRTEATWTWQYLGGFKFI